MVTSCVKSDAAINRLSSTRSSLCMGRHKQQEPLSADGLPIPRFRCCGFIKTPTTKTPITPRILGVCFCIPILPYPSSPCLPGAARRLTNSLSFEVLLRTAWTPHNMFGQTSESKQLRHGMCRSLAQYSLRIHPEPTA